MGKISRFFSALSVFLMVCALVIPAFSSTGFAKGNPKYASIVMDADTGVILHQRHANKSLHPASLTKVMTLLLVFEALEGGKLQLNDRVRVSKFAASMVPSKLGLKAGSSIRVKDAIYALVTKSANDVAVAIAEKLGGSERGFATKMNRKAIEIGMTRTTFRNASGLHNKRQVTTARDMAKMAQHVIRNHPEYYRYFSRKNFSYAGKKYRNHNRLMSSYKGMDGMKTGYINASGFNLIASAVRNNRRIIGVVFGGRTSKTRNAHMEVLLDNGFSKLNEIRIASAKVPLPQRKPHAVAAKGAGVQLAVVNPAVKTALQKGMGELIGQGDFDPMLSKRYETGLMAAAAYSGKKLTPRPRIQQSPALKPTAHVPDAERMVKKTVPWSVQIGAFTNRLATDQAIQKALKSLPQPYDQAQPLIAPLKTAKGWIFRARITGYTREEALAACTYISECLPVAPQN